MKAGMLARIRVNPSDCQSVLDVLDVAGVPRRNMSFSAMVSLALSSLLESARQGGHVPRPDPFQYLERLQPYMGRERNGQKAKVTNAIQGLGPARHVPSFQEAADYSQPVQREEHGLTPAQRGQFSQPARKVGQPTFSPPQEVMDAVAPVEGAELDMAEELEGLIDAKSLWQEKREGSWTPADEARMQQLSRQIYGG